jgi:hypothetical protein
LLCIHAVKSFMSSPWTGSGSTYNSAAAEETGGKTSNRAGVSLTWRPPRRLRQSRKERSKAVSANPVHGAPCGAPLANENNLLV